MGHDPLRAWRRLDYSFEQFLRKERGIDPAWVERLRHFVAQYLLKVANIDTVEARRWGLHVSPWNPPRGSYHRLYQRIPQLAELENCFDQPLLLARECRFFSSEAERSGALAGHVEKGLTPTLQNTAAWAARCGLFQPNGRCDAWPVRRLEKGLVGEFKRRAPLAGRILAKLLEAALKWRVRGLEEVFAASHGRVAHFLTQALRLDLTQYGHVARYEGYLDLLYEELLLWLLLAEPYEEGFLERALPIPRPAFHRMVPTGMAAFTALLAATLRADQTVLVYDGCYFENRLALAKAASVHLVQDLEKTLQVLAFEGKKVDLLFVDFHENVLKGRFRTTGNDVAAAIDALYRTGTAAPSLTVAIDTTIGFLDAPELRRLLERFADKIGAGALHVATYWSHQKFDLFGTDKLSGGSLAVYTSDPNQFAVETEPLDFLSRQGLSHFFAVAPEAQDERRERLFANARRAAAWANPKIAGLVCNSDPIRFSLDVQSAEPISHALLAHFHRHNIPLLTRSTFGLNLSAVSFLNAHVARFSIGLEEEAHLEQFMKTFNAFFEQRPLLSKKRGGGPQLDNQFLNPSFYP